MKTIIIRYIFILPCLAWILISCNSELEQNEQFAAQAPADNDADAGTWSLIPGGPVTSITQIALAAPAATTSDAYLQELAAIKTEQSNLSSAQKEAVAYWNAGGVLRWNQFMRELVARCRALLRRQRQQEPAAPPEPAPPTTLQHQDLILFPGECRVVRDGLELKLSPKEYRLLELFMQHPRRVWSRDQLIEQVWGLDYIGDSKTVDVHIRWLREKIEDDPSNPGKLVTVRGFGYRFG